MKVQEKLKQFQLERKAILATNFYNYETLKGILEAASRVQAPVMLQLTRSSIDYMGLKRAVVLARQGLEDYRLDGCIHLDHGGSVELVQRCLDAGFESVMIDASEKSMEENIETTCKVVEMARPYGANVEAELGYVPKLGQMQDSSGFTTVEDAVRFVRATQVDALAVAIGSAHGFYKSTPRLDIDRLAEIHAATDVVLVLHGSSGIPHDMVREAIRNGIAKVNLATEIKDTFMRALKQTLQNSDEIDLRKVFPKATDSVVELLCDNINGGKRHRMTIRIITNLILVYETLLSVLVALLLFRPGMDRRIYCWKSICRNLFIKYPKRRSRKRNIRLSMHTLTITLLHSKRLLSG